MIPNNAQAHTNIRPTKASSRIHPICGSLTNWEAISAAESVCAPRMMTTDPSLSISSGHKQPVLLKCFAGCTFEQITAKLGGMGLWPVPGADANNDATRVNRRPDRTPEERRQYALRILEDTKRNYGREQAHLLKNYFVNRGIDKVPRDRAACKSVSAR